MPSSLKGKRYYIPTKISLKTARENHVDFIFILTIEEKHPLMRRPLFSQGIK